MQRVHQFAEHVELELEGGRVADAHGTRALVSGQPVQLQLGQSPLPAEAVHDLELRRRAGYGAQEPVAPGARLILVPGGHERVERERRVAQPAIAVVPIALAAQFLRKRSGRRRRDAAGWLVGERLERHQGALLRPFAPACLGLLQRWRGLDRSRRRQVRGPPGQHEWHLLPFSNGELRHRLEVLAARGYWRVQPEAIGAGDRRDAAVDALNPRDDRAVPEAHDQLHPHRHPATISHYDAKHVCALAVDGHQVEDGDAALLSLELGLQDERAVAVAAAHPLHSPGRRQQPAAVVRRPQQCGEGRIRVEARETEPIDRPVLGDEREAAEVSDDGVVLDAGRHPNNLSGRPLARTRVLAAIPVGGTADAWERLPGWRLRSGDAGSTFASCAANEQLASFERIRSSRSSPSGPSRSSSAAW